MKSIFRRAAFMAAVVTIVVAAPAGAHETRGVGGHQIVVGWAQEPAFAGFVNAVSFRATEGGRGLEGLQMKVEVLFGNKDSTEKTEPLALSGAFGDPGHYTASIIPTRPGQYTFRVTGAIDNEPFDQSFSSGEGTFDGVEESMQLQFPAKDPSNSELSKAIEQLDDRTTSSVREARDQTKTARLLAIGAAVLAAIALLFALISRRRRA